MLEFPLKLLLSYLLGSVVGSLVLGRWRGVDIRRLGSGNAGSTNALRTQGIGFAMVVMLIDVAKGWLAVSVIAKFAWGWPGATLVGASGWLSAACATAAMLGHVYPVFDAFRGGKGAAVLLGCLLGMAPYTLLAIVSAWLITAMLLGFVSLATITAAWVLPFLLMATRPMPTASLLWFGVFAALFITLTHHGNIARLRAGTEPRAKALWLLGRGKLHGRGK